MNSGEQYNNAYINKFLAEECWLTYNFKVSIANVYYYCNSCVLGRIREARVDRLLD